MPRAWGSSAERGYGTDHKAERERRLAAYRPGQPCAECGLPIQYWPLAFARTLIDLPHDHVNGGYKPGLAHSKCNRSEGSRRGNRQRRFTPIRYRTSRDPACATCGQTYHYAARICEICGEHYHPSGKTVRTCSRACGIQLRRKLYGTASNGRPKLPRPMCGTCGKPCANLGQRFCSSGCAGQARTIARVTWPSVAVETYNCRYCGILAVRRANAGTLREVCEARICQLARLKANNLVARKGMTKADADALMAKTVARAMANGWARTQDGRSRRVVTAFTPEQVCASVIGANGDKPGSRS